MWFIFAKNSENQSQQKSVRICESTYFDPDQKKNTHTHMFMIIGSKFLENMDDWSHFIGCTQSILNQNTLNVFKYKIYYIKNRKRKPVDRLTWWWWWIKANMAFSLNSIAFLLNKCYCFWSTKLVRFQSIAFALHFLTPRSQYFLAHGHVNLL